VLGAASHLSELVGDLAELDALGLVVDEFGNLEELANLLLLLALGLLRLCYLVIKLSGILHLSTSKLPVEIRAAGEDLQVVCQEQIVVLAARGLQEVPARHRLRDLHSV